MNEAAVHIFGFVYACRTSHALLIRSNLVRSADVRELQAQILSLIPRKRGSPTACRLSQAPTGCRQHHTHGLRLLQCPAGRESCGEQAGNF